MKHLVIFLNYCRSRLDNPVYRQFTNEKPGQRRTTLLFLSKSLEERELVHEVAELRRKETVLSDVTFHICSGMEKPADGESIVQTLRLIHKLFLADSTHHYDCYCYCMLPNIATCEEKPLKVVWDNLACLNNAQASYTEFELIKQAYLYHDQSQCSLAEFLFDTIQSGIRPADYIDADTFKGLPQDRPIEEWPKLFGTFNAAGITYPEFEVRDFLRRLYIQRLLRCSLPTENPTSMEVCTAEAQRILSTVPIQPQRIALQEEMFLNTEERGTQWKPVADYWRETAEMQSQGLGDIPHEDWLIKIRQRMEVTFQSRFRDIGVDYFFQLQGRKTEQYAEIMRTIISEEIDRILKSHPYTPETQKNILRALVNVLQQRVIEIQKLYDDTREAIATTETRIKEVRQKWDSQSFFSRMMGKDGAILHAFADEMAVLFTQKSLLPGCLFAVKLLNELIPQTQNIIDKFDRARHILDEAIVLSQRSVEEADPSQVLGNFSRQQVDLARAQLADDAERFNAQYLQVVQMFFDKAALVDGEDLISRIQSQFAREIDVYLNQRIEAKTLPPVLNQAITQRMATHYADKGGLPAFIDVLKQHTQLDLQVKNENNVNNAPQPEQQNNINNVNNASPAGKYILVTPTETGVADVTHVITDDVSHIEMLHLKQGLRLTDLEGFSGQRMFIEPSLF